ncbi:MAG: UbiA prenyltransferase family protein [Candidatus Thorarchaeota archaeon]|jgi:4-hydroxybenzoate polyprenyltransferase
MNPYLKLLRIRGWYAYLCIAILGFVVAQGFLGQLVDILVFFLMVFAYLGFSFAINDSYDVQEDLLNNLKNNPIATAEIKQNNAILFSVSLGLAGLLLSTWFGLMIFIYQLTLTALSFCYSAPPLRLKSRYPFDILSHGFFFGALILLLPVFVFGPMSNVVVLLAVSIFLFSILVELWNHISDYEGDMKAKLRTTVCVLGIEKSMKIAMVLSLLFPVTLSPLYYSNGYMLLFIFATTLYSFLILWKRSPTFLFSYANLLYGHIMVLVALAYLI